MKKFLSAMREHFRVRFGEWVSGAALFCWGWAFIYVPPELFKTINLYMEMAALAPPWAWVAGAMSIGGLRLIFLIINGSWRRSAHLRALGSGLSATLWFSLIVSYAGNSYVFPNTFPILALLAADVYSLWYAAEEAAHSDINTKHEKFIIYEVKKRI